MTPSGRHLTLFDLSDRELLLVLRDVAAEDADGYAEAADVADRLDIGEDGRRSVACRLSWLKRYGAVEREHERDANGQLRYHRNGEVRTTQRWGLTEVGLQMATGKLTAQQQRSLDKLGDSQMLMTMRWLSQRVSSSDATISKLMDREYRHGVGR